MTQSDQAISISPILLFLRALRSAAKAQPPKLGFFVSDKKLEIHIVATLVSLLAVLGPVSYAVLALYEIGRLRYFNAPIDFLQLTSLGFADVIFKAYPAVIPMVAVLTLAFRFLWLRGIHRAYAVVHATALVSILMTPLVTNPSWKIFWAVIAVSAVLFILFKRSPTLPELGNEQEEVAGPLQTREEKFWRIARRMPFIILVVAILAWMITAHGAKNAELETYYWCNNRGVVLGFYGDKVLMTQLQDGKVGHTFSIRDINTLTDLSYQKIGPLEIAPLWKPSNAR